MNILRVHTIATAQADSFQVYWTNSDKRVGGLLNVSVASPIADKHIVAELAALQHLLEVKAVLGEQFVGTNNTSLFVSLGAIRKLRRAVSDKSHLAPYANFLTTRFAACRLYVSKDTDWFKSASISQTQELTVSEPLRETVTVTGLGKVAVTQHVLTRLAQRFMKDIPAKKVAPTAWKNLVAWASDSSVREVKRDSVYPMQRIGKYTSDEACETDSRYFLNRNLGMVLVVTNKPHEGNRLVTTYSANRHFHELVTISARSF